MLTSAGLRADVTQPATSLASSRRSRGLCADLASHQRVACAAARARNRPGTGPEQARQRLAWAAKMGRRLLI